MEKIAWKAGVILLVEKLNTRTKYLHLRSNICVKMIRQYHRLNGHELKQTLEDSEGQESLVCCSPWGHKESDTT